METILNPAYPHICEKIFMCLNFNSVSISNFRLLNHQLKNTLENVLAKLSRLILLRKFKELTDNSGLEYCWNANCTQRHIQKLEQIWLNLIELLNQEKLWSGEVTENMFLCIFRIFCLIEHSKYKPDYYLQTYYLEPMYLTFKLGNRFENMSLIKIITKPAHSPNFMLSASHEHKDEANEGSNENGNLYLFEITGKKHALKNRIINHFMQYTGCF